MPTITIIKDYDGYFQSLVTKWCKQKESQNTPFNHTEITVSSGPYRSAAVSYKKEGATLHLDFYSALRSGFGALSQQDISSIIELL